MATVMSDSSLDEFRTPVDRVGDEIRSSSSAVSWGAIFAGAASAAVLSLLLVLLGTGLGLSAVSPWTMDRGDAEKIGMTSSVWVLLTQILSAALGGYVAGRLRAKWVAVHTDEVRFRDTAHGFLSWAVASLAMATLFASAAGSIVSGTAKMATTVGSTVASSAATAATAAGVKAPDSESANSNYFVDTLLRPASGQQSGGATGKSANTNTNANGDSAQTTEVARIFANGLKAGALPPDDVHYLGQVVAQRTGLSQEEAESRVNDTYNRLQQTTQEAKDTAKKAADTARKATAQISLWLVISLLLGAVIASWMATRGGRSRDLPLDVPDVKERR